jgi:CheY-like chemotaxis protein
MSKFEKTILVIDDNGINRIIPGLILRPFGWAVHEAESGFEALERLRFIKFSFVLLDVSMPNMSGIDVLLYLKINEISKDIKCIAYTAYAVDKDIDGLLSLGFDAVLLKPLTSSKLLSLLDSFD